jgi:hypothetical protein
VVEVEEVLMVHLEVILEVQELVILIMVSGAILVHQMALAVAEVVVEL